ncbi:amidohydrolase family protein [Bradyrhizobium sp. USDA 3315]
MDVTATRLFCGSDHDIRNDVVLRHDGGVITDISEAARPATGPRSLILPAFVNAHDHARPRASSFGAVGMPLESWILRTVVGTPVDPYLTAASALGRAAQAGCAAMMVPYTRPSGTMPLVEEVKSIARAAGDVGIRIAFAVAVRDQNPIVYGDSEAAGVQWCSEPLLEAVAENSAQTGRRIHMHLLETIYQRAWADRHFPGGIARYLRDIGLLSERLTLAHCIHARPDELEMIAASGARIVTNFSSNLHLRSGLAPIAAAHACGCGIAVGVDGLALDEDDDLLREMRLVQMMHGGLGFKRTWTAQEFFTLAIRNGRRATGAPGTGELAVGAPADFVSIDLDRLEGDQILDADPLDLLFARGNASLISELVVDGRTVARAGRCLGVDLPAIEQELRGITCASAATYAHVLRAWPRLSNSVQHWFEAQLTCN